MSIGTSECFTSSDHCGAGLKSVEGEAGALSNKPLAHVVEVSITWETRGPCRAKAKEQGNCYLISAWQASQRASGAQATPHTLPRPSVCQSPPTCRVASPLFALAGQEHPDLGQAYQQDRVRDCTLPRVGPFRPAKNGESRNLWRLLNDLGFPTSHRKRRKRYFGYQTGDLVRAVVPETLACRGRHVGRVAVRVRGTFNITTKRGKVTDVPYRFCRPIGRTTGYSYQTGERHAVPLPTSR